MTGGLIQLVAYGLQDLFLTKDPQITFFKVVYRRHTNFSMEQIPQYFITQPDFGTTSTCVLAKQGDLISQIYLLITLPRIKQFYIDQNTLDNVTKFAWVRKLGYAMINYIEIEIGGQVIDKHYGDWLNIWAELFSNTDTERSTDAMIGNIPELTDYSNGKDSYTLYVPLQFWFCRNSGLALPLISLQYSDIKIRLELKSAEQCYVITPTNYITVYNDIVNLKPYEYIEQNVNGQIASGIFTSYDIINKRLYYKRISRNPFLSIQSTSAVSVSDITNLIFDNNANLKYSIRGTTTGNLAMPAINASPVVVSTNVVGTVSLSNCFLLVDYIYLDDDERTRFVQSKHDYLIEQVSTVNPKTVEGINRQLRLDLLQPSKLLVWTLQQDYFIDTVNNDFFNYTDSYVYNGTTPTGKSLIQQETIVLNGKERLSKRSYVYFNHIQPYQYLKHQPDEGINMYSFSNFPDKYQPSGSCNMSQIDQIAIDIFTQNVVTVTNVAIFRCFSFGYNVLRIVNGLSGIVFTK